MTETINFKGKTTCIFGLRGTGKSTQRDNLFTQFGELGLLYDTLWETPADVPYHIYRPADRYSVFELCDIVGQVIQAKKTHNPLAYDYIGIEEANRFIPSKPKTIPPVIADLNDMCRDDAGHYGIGVLYLCRRPCQLNQDITELSDYIMVYRLEGNNDIKYLNNIANGLGDAAKELPDYHYLLVNQARKFEIMTPVTPGEIWLQKHKIPENNG